MKILRKLIFLAALINLVRLNSCENDDLYQNYISEQQKALESIQQSLMEQATKNVAVPARGRRDFASGESEYEDDNDEENEANEHFKSLFNHMRAYRDKMGVESVKKIGELLKWSELLVLPF